MILQIIDSDHCRVIFIRVKSEYETLCKNLNNKNLQMAKDKNVEYFWNLINQVNEKFENLGEILNNSELVINSDLMIFFG